MPHPKEDTLKDDTLQSLSEVSRRSLRSLCHSFSFALVGLSASSLLHPRLAPWAVLLRHFAAASFLSFVALSAPSAFADECVSFSEARHFIGKTQCIAGTIVHVKEAVNGTMFLDFCDDYEVCPFTVVVFANDLRRVGDVRQLKGRSIQVRGRIEEYEGRAEIILKHSRQLGEAASLLPALSGDAAIAPTPPTDYDVERRGHFSPGKMKHAKKAKTSSAKKQGPPVSVNDPGQEP